MDSVANSCIPILDQSIRAVLQHDEKEIPVKRKKILVAAAGLAALVGSALAAPSALASGSNQSTGFVWFSNHSFNIPTFCITTYDDGFHQRYHGCATMWRSKGAGFRFGPQDAHAKVDINNGKGDHYHLYPLTHWNNCYRETDPVADVHRATDKPCTWG
jgi:hypothetical protein